MYLKRPLQAGFSQVKLKDESMLAHRSIVYFFSDFGPHGPYTGQVEAVIRERTSAQFINLLSNAPFADPYHSSYLLAALYNELPVKSGYLLAVVDPGVGGARQVITFQIGKMTFLGPDNGLFSRLISQHGVRKVAILEYPANKISNSFHARDWFAPELARLINGESINFKFRQSQDLTGYDWSEAVHEIIYRDHYGNLVTGLPAENLDRDKQLSLNGKEIDYARTFSEVSPGSLFWYENSMGLAEIAANQASAAELLQAGIGTAFDVS